MRRTRWRNRGPGVETQSNLGHEIPSKPSDRLFVGGVHASYWNDTDGSLGDGRLVFEASARPAFAALAGPVQRNVRFVEEQWVVNHFVDAHVMGGAGVQKDGARDPWAGA